MAEISVYSDMLFKHESDMDSLTISPETYAASFSECKPGEVVTGTFTGTVGAASPDGSYPIELTAVTKDEAAEQEEVGAEMPEMAGASPAAKAVLKK